MVSALACADVTTTVGTPRLAAAASTAARSRGRRLREPLQLEQVGRGDGGERQQRVADRRGGRLAGRRARPRRRGSDRPHRDAGLRALDAGDGLGRRGDGLGRGKVAVSTASSSGQQPSASSAASIAAKSAAGTACRAIRPRPGRLASSTVGSAHTSWPSHCSAGTVASRPTWPRATWRRCENRASSDLAAPCGGTARQITLRSSSGALAAMRA